MLKPIKLKGEQKNVLFLPPTNPIQIKGVAGSGKTTVALYRAKHLLETQSNLFEEARIVIFTFNRTLANYIKKISPYVNGGYQKDSDEIRPKTKQGLNVQITNFHRWAYHFAEIDYNKTITQNTQIDIIRNIIKALTSNTSNILNKSPEFFQEEISWIKGKLFSNKEEYIDAKRTGRGTSDRVTKVDKEVIWTVYEYYTQKLNPKSSLENYLTTKGKLIKSVEFHKPKNHFRRFIVSESLNIF